MYQFGISAMLISSFDTSTVREINSIARWQPKHKSSRSQNPKKLTQQI